MSSWLEERRDEYVARLRGALGTRPQAWNEWATFFLRGIDEQATRNAQTAREILALHERLKRRVIDLTHSQYAIPMLDQIFQRPIFQTGHLEFGPRPPSKQAISTLVRALRDEGILRVLREGAGRRPAVYVFAELMNLCEGTKAF